MCHSGRDTDICQILREPRAALPEEKEAGRALWLVSPWSQGLGTVWRGEWELGKGMTDRRRIRSIGEFPRKWNNLGDKN